MTRWERIEHFMDAHVPIGATFTSAQYAQAEGLSGPEASEHIQCYLLAQRGAKSRTKYVLKRMSGTRTRNAQWSVGQRAMDARRVSVAFSDDVKAKWMRAVEPDLLRLATINPGAAKRVERICDATLDGALKVLEAAVRA